MASCCRSPQAKRPRTDETDEDNINAKPQQDESFWFEDGNVVVVTQQIVFRVHRGVLSRHSETFSGLFTLPRPTAAEEFDGCPVVRVTDSSYDFKHLLHALYDGLGYVPGMASLWPCSSTHASWIFRYMESVSDREKYSMHASLARLGHKYELPSVLSAALQRLRATHTEDYKVWKALWVAQLEGSTPGPDSHSWPIEAVNLFRATGQTNMLPTALFLQSKRQGWKRWVMMAIKRELRTWEDQPREDGAIQGRPASWWKERRRPFDQCRSAVLTCCSISIAMRCQAKRTRTR